MVSSHLLNKVAQTAAGTMGWIFLTTLKANMDSALHDATAVYNVQRCLEELEQCMALKQENHGPEEASISDSKVLSDGEDEHYETVSTCLAARPIVQKKVKTEQPMAEVGASSRSPQCV